MFAPNFNTPFASGATQFGFTQTQSRQQSTYSLPTSPPFPVGDGFFNSNPSSPGLQVGSQASSGLGSPSYESYVGGRVGSPPLNSPLGRNAPLTKKQQWYQLALERTRSLQSGLFQPSAIGWFFVSNGVIPSNAINLGNEGQPSFLCRSFYEDQLRVGRVTYGPEGLKAFVTCKGKEIVVKEYEILVQAAALPQFSFAQNQQQQASLPVPQVQQPVSKPSNPQDLVDIVFVVDDSDSMEGTRWSQVRNALSGITQACRQVDADGFDLFFLNNNFSRRDILNTSSVSDAFEFVGGPDGATPTGFRLRRVLDFYISRLESRNSKPVSIVVITDGDPTDDVETVIVEAAHRLEASRISANQLSIHFVQIGDDPQAAAALKHLDDALEQKYQIEDIVETTVNQGHQTHFTTDTLVEVLQTLWKKQTIQTSFNSTFVASPAPQQTALPSSLLSPLSPTLENANYFTANRQNVQNRHSPTGTSFSSKKDWIQQAKQLTASTLTAFINPSSLLPYSWVFVESGVPPANAIACGKENEQDTFFARSFYEGQLRYGTIAAGASKAVVVINNSREASVEQYEVLVQASGFFYSFVAGPSVAQQTGRTMDIVLVVDDSDSMTSDGRWNQARDALAAVAEGSPRFDDDGVDLYFLNSDRFQKNIKTRNEVVHLFNSIIPDGATPTGTRLTHVLEEYIPLVERRSRDGPTKPVNIIVITDGDPSDDVESVIVKAAQRLHRAQVPEHMLGIQFVQIGNDVDATLALQRLDRALHKKHNIRDMVDTTPFDPKHPEFTDDVIFKILLGAIDRKIDRLDETLRITL